MSFEDEFLEMMPDSITVEHYIGISQRGDPSYGAPASYRCRIEENLEQLRRAGVEETQFDVLAYVEPAAAVGTQDRVTLPDGRRPPVRSVNSVRDEEGLHHYEVVFGRPGVLGQA